MASLSDADAEDVLIRRAERADLLSIYRIEKTVFKQPWPYSAFESFLGEDTFLVAIVDGSVVGYIVADVTPNFGRDIGHVKDLAVHPDAQGRGLGRRLLQRGIVGMVVDGGAAMVKLEVRASNDRAQKLYYDEGFRPMRRIPRYYSDEEAALVMVLDPTERNEAERPSTGDDIGRSSVGDETSRSLPDDS